jgi:hypothetical protein
MRCGQSYRKLEHKISIKKKEIFVYRDLDIAMEN